MFLQREMLRVAPLSAKLSITLVEIGSGAASKPRLEVVSSVVLNGRDAMLPPARLLALLAPRLQGSLWHARSQRHTFPVSSHHALARALANPAAFLPPYSQLYAESPPSASHYPALAEPLADPNAESRRLGSLCRAEYAALQQSTHTLRVESLWEPTVRALCAPVLSAFSPDTRPRGVPAPLWARLFPYQREGVAYMLNRRGRALLCDEMGVGKSLQGMVVALACRVAFGYSAWPCLVVVPSSLRMQWQRAFEEWADYRGDGSDADAALPYDVASPTESRSAAAYAETTTTTSTRRAGTGPRSRISPTGVTILSYDLCRAMQDALAAVQFGTALLDEAHYIKTPTAQRTAAALRAVGLARHVVAISGTPATSRPIELFTQLRLMGVSSSDMHAYGTRYCGAVQTQFGWEYRGASRIQELSLVLKHTCMLRRLKSQVCTQLPPVVRERVYVDVGAQKKKEIAALKADLADLRSRGSTKAADAVLMEAVRRTAYAKVPSILRYLDDAFREQDEEASVSNKAPAKTILFAHHLAVLDALESHLRKRGIDVVRLDGSTPDEGRVAAMTRFQTEPKCRVFLASITAAGVGINLTAASDVAFCELAWNPSDMLQAESRADRIGQTADRVSVRYLVAADTTDEYLWSLLERKLGTVSELLDGAKRTMGAPKRASEATGEPPAKRRAPTKMKQ